MSNQNGGWIKLHRKILEWEWYGDTVAVRLFLHLLLTANHEPKQWMGMEIGRGETVVGTEDLAKKLGVGRQSIRTAIRRLKSTNEITIKSSNKYSLVKLNNWDTYQDVNQLANQQLTNNQPTTNQQLTTPKEVKNIRIKELKNGEGEGRGTFVPPTRDEVEAYCRERGNSVDPGRFADFYASKGWMVGKTRMKDWKAAVRGWEARDSAEAKGKPKSDPGSVTLHDGSRAVWKWGRWVDADNPNVAIDVGYYPELTKN